MLRVRKRFWDEVLYEVILSICYEQTMDIPIRYPSMRIPRKQLKLYLRRPIRNCDIATSLGQLLESIPSYVFPRLLLCSTTRTTRSSSVTDSQSYSNVEPHICREPFFFFFQPVCRRRTSVSISSKFLHRQASSSVATLLYLLQQSNLSSTTNNQHPTSYQSPY